MKVMFVILAPLLLLATACDLPPIPSFVPVDSTDTRTDEDLPPGTVVCEAASRVCLGNSVRVCSADGEDFSVEACSLGQTCVGGTCAPIQNTCRGSQPFALSANELTFDVSDDLKTQTKQLRLENCSSIPFIVRGAFVRGPERPDGTPVFELIADITQSSVQPGESLFIKVVYRPTRGLAHVDGKLELSLVLDELTNVEIALRSKAICATASPRLDFGMTDVGVEEEAVGLLQNCGNEPLTLTGWTAPAILEVDVAEKIPYTMRPDEEIPFVVTVAPQTPGFLDSMVEFRFDEVSETSPTTRIRGIATEPECVPLLLSGWEILTNNLPVAPKPGALLRLRYPDAPADLLQWTRLTGQPNNSHIALERVTSGWTLRPRVVGNYEAEFTGYDITTGRPGCGRGTVPFAVEPSDGLFVELSWVSEGDGIIDDQGYGHGVNLDLHVLSVEEDGGSWNDEATACFPGAIGPCGAGNGTIAISQAGGIAEFVHFDDPTDLQFEIGVYVSNPFNFEGATARVRVYRDQTLVADVTNTSLQTANDFWLVGRWDGVAQEWTEIDRAFSGFPR